MLQDVVEVKGGLMVDVVTDLLMELVEEEHVVDDMGDLDHVVEILVLDVVL